MVCPHGQGGSGSIFRDFVRASFLEGPLVNAVKHIEQIKIPFFAECLFAQGARNFEARDEIPVRGPDYLLFVSTVLFYRRYFCSKI